MFQVVSAQATLLQCLVVAIAIVFIVLEATNHAVQGHKRASLIAQAAIACICLAVTLLMAGMLLKGIHDNVKAAKRWYVPFAFTHSKPGFLAQWHTWGMPSHQELLTIPKTIKAIECNECL